MMVREKTSRFELYVTVPEDYAVGPVAQRIERAMRQIKPVRKEDIEFSGLFLLEEGDAHEVIK
jgi:hypothetical protein